MKRMIAGKILASSIAMSGWIGLHAQATNPADTQFSNIADQYFDQVYFPYSPTQATAAGFHQYDAKLEDYSHTGINREIAALHAFLPKVEGVSRRH